MSVSASRRAWWSRQELLAWVLHRRNSAVDNVEKVAAEKGSSLLQSMEAGLAAYYATFARRGPGKIPTPGRVLAAHRLLKCAEASGKISANRAGRFSSKVARDLWEGPDAGRPLLSLHPRNDVFRLAAAIQERPKRDYAPRHEIRGAGTKTHEDNARRNILKECGITARKRPEISSLFRAAIRFACKELYDGKKQNARRGEKLIRLADGMVIYPSVPMPSPPIDSEEFRRRLQNIKTWAAKGRPRIRNAVEKRYLIPAAGTSKNPSV
jgi:hypothetical protein